MTTAIKSQSKATSKEAIDSVSRGSIVTMGVASALVGIWAIACLVSAMIGSTGPIELIKSWFSATMGI